MDKQRPLPAQRHASMEAFLSELKSINPHQRSPWPLVAGSACLLFVAGLVGYLLYATRVNEPNDHGSETPAVVPEQRIVRKPLTPTPVCCQRLRQIPRPPRSNRGGPQALHREHAPGRLSIHDGKLTRGHYGSSKYTARIRNEDSLPVKYANLVVVLYDQQDRIISVSPGFAKRKELPPEKSPR